MESFSGILKHLRNREHLTQLELADKLGIAKSTVSMYENGNREPDFDTLVCIADFFNVDMNYLLGKTTEHSYYLNQETQQIAQEIFENEDLKILFDTTRDCTPEDMKKVISMINISPNYWTGQPL